MGGLSAWRQQLLAELLVCLFPLRATSHQPHRGSDPASHTAAQIHTQHTQIPDPHCHMGAHGLASWHLAPRHWALRTICTRGMLPSRLNNYQPGGSKFVSLLMAFPPPPAAAAAPPQEWKNAGCFRSAAPATWPGDPNSQARSSVAQRTPALQRRRRPPQWHRHEARGRPAAQTCTAWPLLLRLPNCLSLGVARSHSPAG
jgi:hypothetical protein